MNMPRPPPQRCSNRPPSAVPSSSTGRILQSSLSSLLSQSTVISPPESAPSKTGADLSNPRKGPPPSGHCTSAPPTCNTCIQRDCPSAKSKQLRFNSAVRGVFYETYTNSHQQTWYSPDEFRVLQTKVHTDVKLLRGLRKQQRRNPHVPLSTSDQAALDATPVQGVEHMMSKKTFSGRRHQQRAAIHGVLAEQQRQRAEGRSLSSVDHGYDHEKLALVSAALSFDTRQRALADGRHYAEEVRCEASRGKHRR